MNTQVIIIGGGIAGLTTSIGLAKHGIECLVIEKRTYPEHKVCGEYLSKESEQVFDLLNIEKSRLVQYPVSDIIIAGANKQTTQKLKHGGYGYSRFELDHDLYTHALSLGVRFALDETATAIKKYRNRYQVTTDKGTYQASIVIGSYGKRSNLDSHLQRKFLKERTGYTGIKYHLKKTQFPDNSVGLYFFKGGYAGLINSTGDVTCFCYMISNNLIREKGSIDQAESYMKKSNSFLGQILEESESSYVRPKAISELYFKYKSTHSDDILMCGDAAGMIAPLCGNGMTMALQSGYILSAIIGYNLAKNTTAGMDQMKAQYNALWNKQFRYSLALAEKMQSVFLHPGLHSILLGLIHRAPSSINIISGLTRKELASETLV